MRANFFSPGLSPPLYFPSTFTQRFPFPCIFLPPPLLQPISRNLWEAIMSFYSIYFSKKRTRKQYFSALYGSLRLNLPASIKSNSLVCAPRKHFMAVIRQQTILYVSNNNNNKHQQHQSFCVFAIFANFSRKNGPLRNGRKGECECD